tara:strand:- start:154 stop:393 length:240 start_codon:yes stop_codon:yes gene_type:complete
MQTINVKYKDDDEVYYSNEDSFSTAKYSIDNDGIPAIDCTKAVISYLRSKSHKGYRYVNDPFTGKMDITSYIIEMKSYL